MWTKISLLLLFFMTTVLLGSGMFSYYSLRDTLEGQFEMRKTEVGKRLQVSLSAPAWFWDKETAASILDGELASSEVHSIQAYLLRRGETPLFFASRARNSDGVIAQGPTEEISGVDVLRLPIYNLTADGSGQAANSSSPIGYVLITFSRLWVDQFLAKLLRNRFIEIGILDLILGVLLFLVLSRMVINPLAELSHAFKALADNPQGGEINIEQRDEFGEVVIAFNQIERRLA